MELTTNCYIMYQKQDRVNLEIRQRDNFTCQLCGTYESWKAFPVHHIDYNKQNSSNNNLVLLCNNCHPKVNFSRNKWEFLLTCLSELIHHKVVL